MCASSLACNLSCLRLRAPDWLSCCRQAGSAKSTPTPAYPRAGSSNAFIAQLRNNITPIPEQYSQQGIPAAEHELYDRSALEHSLKQDYVPVNLQHPGLTVQCLEPPVLTADNFMTADECRELAQAAEATGQAALALHLRTTLCTYTLHSALYSALITLYSALFALYLALTHYYSALTHSTLHVCTFTLHFCITLCFLLCTLLTILCTPLH